MSANAFNPLEAARDLNAAGIEAEQAEAIAEGMRRAVSARHSPASAGAGSAEVVTVTSSRPRPLSTRA